MKENQALLGTTVPGESADERHAAPRLDHAASFNVNHKVRIRITARGRDHLRETGRLSMLTPGYSTAVDDATGYATWQLWEVMSVFGSVMYMGGSVPFETEIELVPDANDR